MSLFKRSKIGFSILTLFVRIRVRLVGNFVLLGLPIRLSIALIDDSLDILDLFLQVAEILKAVSGTM